MYKLECSGTQRKSTGTGRELSHFVIVFIMMTVRVPADVEKRLRPTWTTWVMVNVYKRADWFKNADE